jgi:hypothetical protein
LGFEGVSWKGGLHPYPRLHLKLTGEEIGTHATFYPNKDQSRFSCDPLDMPDEWKQRGIEEAWADIKEGVAIIQIRIKGLDKPSILTVSHD